MFEVQEIIKGPLLKRGGPIFAVCICLMLTSPLHASVDCNIHKIYCGILKLRPNINKSWAMKFSDLLFKHSQAYKLDPIRSLAIAMQESSLRTDNHRKSRVIRFFKPCPNCKETYEVISGISDLSVFQFHVDTIKAYNLDPIRLKSDLEYAVRSHFKILSAKIRLCNHWACYNSATPSVRDAYERKVNRWYKKLVPDVDDMITVN